MAFNKKRSLFFLITALVSLVLISASLSSLQLHAGAPFPTGNNDSNSGSQSAARVAPVDLYLSPILKALFAIVFLVLVIQVSARLIALVNLKWFLRLLLAMLILFLVASLLSRLPGGQPVEPAPVESFVATPSSFAYPVSPLGEPSQDLIRLVLIGFMFGAALLAIRILRRRQPAASIEDQLSQEAESAIQAIRVGENLRSVIVRCYLQMTQALQAEQGIERSTDMTVREFEGWLESKGFPAGPVHKLSRLFEQARYSQQIMIEADEQSALESLGEIIGFCHSKRD